MTNTYDTSNEPLGSTAVKVLYNNASNLDEAVNSDADTWVDRPPFGRIRRTWRGMENAFDQFLLNSGYQFIGDYDVDGPLTITAANQIFSKDGEYWRAGPSLALPYTTVNDWVVDQPKFVSVGDAVLRQDLASSTGFEMIGLGDVSLAEVLPIDPRSKGAKGDGVTDDTLAIQAALDEAAANGRGVLLGDGVYSVSTLTVKAGTRFADFTKGTIKGMGTAPSSVIELGEVGAPLGALCRVSARMDMSNGDRIAIRGRAASDCIIENCRITGFTNHATLNHYGILLDGGSRNVIRGNNIVGVPNPTQRGLLIDLNGQGQTDYGGFYTGSPVRATAPCVGNVISGNILTAGSYAVNILGGEKNIVANNYCHSQNHRSIYVAAASWENLIIGNQCSEYLSSGILLGYCASHNTVVGNHLSKVGSVEGEAAININTGARANRIFDNRIYSVTNYGIYMGVDMANNIVSGNTVQGHYLAGIMLENDWIASRPPLAIFSRPNYGPPEQGATWAHIDSTLNIIRGNTIGLGYPGRNTAAIAVAQIDGGGTVTATRNNVIEGNTVDDPSQIAYNLHLYANTVSRMSGLRVVNNAWHPAPTFLAASLGVAIADFNLFVSSYGGNVGFDTLLDAVGIVLTAGTPTPAISTNAAKSNQRVFSLANTVAQNITDFTGASDGMEILVRLDGFSTLVHNNAVMRLKGSANVAPTSTNNFIRLRRISGIWFEVGRSF